MASASRRGSDPRKTIRSDAAEERASSSSRPRSGPSPITISRACGTRAIALMATPRSFWRVRRPTKTNVPGSSGEATTSRSGAGLGRTEIRCSSSDRGEVGARGDESASATQSARPGPLQNLDSRGARMLKLLERPMEEAVTARAFVRGVRDELGDERRARNGRGNARCSIGRRGVDHVCCPGAARRDSGDAAVPNRERR
jgi:hypothetical protein